MRMGCSYELHIYLLRALGTASAAIIAATTVILIACDVASPITLLLANALSADDSAYLYS